MDTWFSLPTVSDERPIMTNLPAYPDFTVTLSGDDWRQAEFINIDKLCTVGEEMDEIKDIRINHSKSTADGLRSFLRLHVRRRIGAAELFIPLFELKALLRSHTVGSIAFESHPGFVKNGFALSTPFGFYYGLEENGVVKSLALHNGHETAERDIRRIMWSYHLLFVQWCHCNIHTP
ncbi:hypothetical protein [Chitinophaga cymbidii]|uniref:Uncharacterized protein n=1 Tax=Chitinophaga cymbidii TaxID=1096750 RepID=A0A512RHI6_9BACT|nr:hypothetical protein [Chitinophaga cymbidii]GEP95166.1 hypothetical protein CCY01nite_14260 [Chitinophaga cymbidii]